MLHEHSIAKKEEEIKNIYNVKPGKNIFAHALQKIYIYYYSIHLLLGERASTHIKTLNKSPLAIYGASNKIVPCLSEILSGSVKILATNSNPPKQDGGGELNPLWPFRTIEKNRRIISRF